MAAIRPFRALRPSPESAARVASVPYDVVSGDEARTLARGNPLSFLHVTRSEIDLPAKTDPYAPEVYAQAAANLERIRREAPLVVEEEPCCYFYRLKMGGREQIGVAAAFSLDEYDADRIKKHERTRRDKEDDRTQHITALRAQTGVVFLTYRASQDVDEIAKRATATEPLYDFVAADGVAHTVWRAAGENVRPLMEAFDRVPALFIADGHHRAASAARTRERIDSEAARWFLAVAFPDKQVQILPYNRVVKDLAGMTPASFVEKLGERLFVTNGGPVPERKGEASMYLDGRWYTLGLSALAGEDRIGSLDVSVLQKVVLDAILGIADVRTDKRIDFVGGARGTPELERLVDSGKAAVAFSLHPVTIGDLMSIADAGGIMPPKSTWFEPKLRDGLLIYTL
ncbi:MAG TPA: DUF1015 family protein [Vicinamibacterales bacterium]|nr:DUF1015 family protein [Vicinamibacterales bacterium]